MQNYCTIYLVRHGETDWNKKKLVQGQTDTPLNKKGELQAKELGEKFKGINFEAVFSSDLIRSGKTAEIMFFKKKLAVVKTKALRERLYGRFEGRHISDLRKIIGELVLLSKEKQKKLKLYDVESDDQILNRLIPFLRETAVTYPGKNVLMVSHGGLMRVFLNHLGYKIPEYSEKSMKNAGYIIIKSDGMEFMLKEEKLFK